MSNVAVAVLCFDRPQYLYKCLESLENNAETERYDFFAFQDGAVNKFSGRRHAKDEDIQKCITLIEESDIDFEQRISDKNVGVALQRDKVFGLFDEGYDLVLHIEDDVILGKYGLRILEKLSNQFEDAIPSIHRKKDWDKILDPLGRLNEVILAKLVHWWTAGIRKEIHKDLEDRWADYIDIMKDVDYHDEKQYYGEKIEKEFSSPISSSDRVYDELLSTHGYYKVEPVVSRASYIGRDGLHFNPQSYREKQVGREGPLTFEQDTDIESFQVVKDARR